MTVRPPDDDFRVDFFGIGAPKCMTTWMAQVLDEHPGICISREKQPNYFREMEGLLDRRPNPDFLSDWAWYKGMWDHAEPGALLGDYSTVLLYNETSAPKLLLEHNPDVRCIVQLRDPVERTHSSWHHHVRHDNPVPRDFAEFASKEEVLRRARYHELLTTWIDVIPQAQFHVVLDLDIKRDSLRAYRETVDFLGADPDFEPPSLRERINRPIRKRGFFKVLEKGARGLRGAGLGPLMDAVNAVGVGPLVRWVGLDPVERPPIDPEVEAELRSYFLPDVEALEELIDRDLTPWKPGGA